VGHRDVSFSVQSNEPRLIRLSAAHLEVDGDSGPFQDHRGISKDCGTTDP
jgi:hypothetical protein